MIMADPQMQDPHPLEGALSAIRDAIGWCRPLIGNADPAMAAAMLDTAVATSEISGLLLQQAMPPADDEEPGVGEALERAGELAADARRHLVTGLNLMVGAHAITTSITEGR
jgi:hypothetical protein